MTDLVVIIPLHVKNLLEPVKQRHFRIGIMTADHQDDAMNQNEYVG